MSERGRFREEGLRVTLYRFNATKKGVLHKAFNFQCAPLEEFAWTQGGNHSEFETLARGQFSRRGGRALLTFDIRTLIVDYQPKWTSWHQARPNNPNPQEGAKLMRQLVNIGTPFYFYARSAYWGGADLRLPVTLRSVQSSERAGEPDARYLDLSFSEWREQELDRKGRGKKRHRHALPTTVEITDDGRAREVAHDDDEQAKSVYQAGDKVTLQDLALNYYGDPTYWRAICRENGISDFPPTRGLQQLTKRGKRVRKLRIPDLADPKTGGVEAPV